MTTLLGGEDFVAIKLDDTIETVRIRQLSIRLYPQYLAALNSEPRTVALYCDKAEGWVDSLTLESFEGILLRGEEINRDFFTRWNDRRKKREELQPKIDPEETMRLMGALGKSNPELLANLMQQAGLPSPTSSPK